MPLQAAPSGRFSAPLSKLQEWLPQISWLFLGLLLIAVLWLNTNARIEREKKEADKAIRAQATSVVNSYAQQLHHMVEQIDQISLRLKYNWEDPDTAVNLDKEYRYGLFPIDRLLYANIFDTEGDLLTSTLPSRPEEVNVFSLPYFQGHKAGCCPGLLITEPSASRTLGHVIVRFTRRLNRPDGSFAGVVVVAVEPRYLITFQENAVVGQNDFVSVRLTTGPLLASKVNTGEDNNGATVQPPVFYRDDPVFPTPSGIATEAAEKFHDNRPRLVAWKKLEQYPLVAIAGLSVKDAFAPFEAEARSLRDTALMQSLLIFGAALGAALFAAALAKRRRQAEEIQDTYRLATDAANEGFYMIRPIYDHVGDIDDFRLEDCNNRAAELIGAKREDLVGIRASQLQPESFRNEILAQCRLASRIGFLEEEVRVSPRSPLRAKWIYRRIVKSSAGLALTIRDITQAKMQEKTLADLANNDTLTHLPNRNWLNTYLPDAVRQASLRAGLLAVLFVDLDNFKNVNDTLGHDAGDELLVQAARRLKEAVRSSDHVARLGGDEFVIILDHVDTVEDVSRVARAITETIGKPFSLEAGTGNQVSASIGISLFPQDGTDSESLLKHADIAMYAAKAAGKGRHALYDPHFSDSLLLRLSTERALRQAVESDEFIVHYQPRVGIKSGRLTSMEALVRWERPGHGLVYPSDFIGMAEDVGLIVQIGELVIDKVSRQVSLWKSHGIAMVPVSVNVSPQQLKSGTLSGFLRGSIERFGIEPELIEVELTESAVIDKSVTVSAELAALRALGIKLMIDDFGTGYSSMAQLHRLDVDILKVDRAFTQALNEGSEGRLLYGAIVSMASALNMGVVAEGVETDQELSILEALACDEIQGFIVSQPVAPGDMAQLMSKQILLATRQGNAQVLPA